MNELWMALTAGIVSGVLVTIIVVVFNQIWLKIIQPWYEDRVFKDARIEGQWKAKVTFDTEETEELWEIRRQGHSISGTITAVKGADQGRTYDVEGTFSNLILTVSYRSTDPGSVERGTVTMILQNNGQTFKGSSAFYFDPDHAIRSSEYECTKQ